MKLKSSFSKISSSSSKVAVSVIVIARHLLPLALLALATACSHQPAPFEVCFYKLSWEERVRLAQEFSPELQMRLYLFGVSQRHPADTYVAEAMAKSEGWHDLIPLIIGKLEEPVAWNERYYLLRLVRDMTYRGRDFRNEEALLRSMDAAAETFVGNPSYLKQTRKFVEQVKKGPDRIRD